MKEETSISQEIDVLEELKTAMVLQFENSEIDVPYYKEKHLPAIKELIDTIKPDYFIKAEHKEGTGVLLFKYEMEEFTIHAIYIQNEKHLIFTKQCKVLSEYEYLERISI